MNHLSAIPGEALAAAQTHLKCKKCLISVVVGLGALTYFGVLSGADFRTPATLLKPAGILLGAQFLSEFVLTEAGHFGYNLLE